MLLHKPGCSGSAVKRWRCEGLFVPSWRTFCSTVEEILFHHGRTKLSPWRNDLIVARYFLKHYIRMSKQKKAANAAKKSSRSAMRRTLMFLGDAAAGNGSRSNNSSRLLIIFLCGYFFSSSAVVMPCVIPAKSTPAFCAVSASTVLSRCIVFRPW